MGRRLRLHGAVLTAMLAAAGCGPTNDVSRVGVSGRVTLGAEPLPTGMIAFVPLVSGPAASGTISEGAYSIARSQGPGPGSYRVEIYSVRPTGKQVKDRGNNQELIEEKRNFVPRRYNTESELKAEIKPGSDQVLDYRLEPTEEKAPTRVPNPRGGRP